MKYEKWTYCPMYYCDFNTKDEENYYRCTIGKCCDTCGMFSKEEVLRLRISLLNSKFKLHFKMGKD